MALTTSHDSSICLLANFSNWFFLLFFLKHRVKKESNSQLSLVKVCGVFVQWLGFFLTHLLLGDFPIGLNDLCGATDLFCVCINKKRTIHVF